MKNKQCICGKPFYKNLPECDECGSQTREMLKKLKEIRDTQKPNIIELHITNGKEKTILLIKAISLKWDDENVLCIEKAVSSEQ